MIRFYSLIMAISISCGGGKAGDDASGSSTGDTGVDPSGSSTDETPTTSSASASTDDGTGTGASNSDPTPGTTGPATSVGETDTGTGEDATGPSETTGGPSSTGGTSTTGDGTVSTAAVDSACAPDDGPALEFRLGVDAAECGAPWSFEQLRILLWNGGPLAPGEYVLDGGNGFATYDDGMGMQASGMTGKIVIESWSDAEVVGSYDVTLDDQSVHFGNFVGPRCMTNPMCG